MKKKFGTISIHIIILLSFFIFRKLSLVGIYFSIIITFYLALLVSYWFKKIQENEDFIPPERIDKEFWNKTFNLPENKLVATKYIGILESFLSLISFVSKNYVLLVAWLAFKQASKWAAWNTILKLPENINTIEELQYFKARNIIGSHTLQRWLLGTLSNIMVGFIGAKLGPLVYRFLYIN